jgi:hypothetical protein
LLLSALSFATTSGFEIWQIEKLQAVPVPKESYGKFFTGDSYIILKVLSFAHVVNVPVPVFRSMRKICSQLHVSSTIVYVAYILTPKIIKS